MLDRTKIGILTALAFLTGLSSAQAENYMNADEVRTLMSGNSISGVFGDNKAYKQRNHANGIAVVAVKGDPVRLIPWFVDDQARYCEDWLDWGVFCFKLRQGDTANKIISLRPSGEELGFDWHEGFIDITHE
ncbi:hypothetical protein [Kiloniella laminariae]|uniref:hypothetical protein n=1 Tax=Kiloniella laminariae TaxID=454162 RepID=UPI00037AF9BB|nr:hypothetical protein [Kiloniella laminariae]